MLPKYYITKGLVKDKNSKTQFELHYEENSKQENSENYIAQEYEMDGRRHCMVLIVKSNKNATSGYDLYRIADLTDYEIVK